MIAAADFVLLAVPDDALRPLVAGLADTGAWREGQLVAHTSGAQGIAVLDPAAARGVLALALHPVMTFAGRPEDVDRLSGATFGVTALDELRPVAESLVVEMGGEPVWVPESARPLYHAALSIGSNHLVTLVNDALSLLDRRRHRRGRAAARAAAVGVAGQRAAAARCGADRAGRPRRRRHPAAAPAGARPSAAPELLPSYLAMARRTAERAHAAGQLGDDGVAAVLAALA